MNNGGPKNNGGAKTKFTVGHMESDDTDQSTTASNDTFDYIDGTVSGDRGLVLENYLDMHQDE